MTVDPKEWVGLWQMNHDGWVGKLRNLLGGLIYTDQNGQDHSGWIVNWSQGGQHMRFIIKFPDHQQTFDAYLFSWDKTKMAGITYWEGQTFGFYAYKI
ncbi:MULTISPECIES: hypothetical protein [unclassified Bacillus (in: firmicutes)]|uniref:hypothetical protein n=1 Tax=unclassified Bacillus (in: firmicutes) TaxID=185979 RepID=UPI000BF8DA17|nr:MULTISPECIES: hypothetical protein [unclassified Bacillus (in: firmicutes)]PEU18130.1 hypothetical protein CN525_13000 [Bacillus sp. AFS014408]PFW62399.1 hypothetical protein COL20_13210 [Bacillus sp. AFS075034]